MLARKPRMLVIVALANKMARAVWLERDPDPNSDRGGEFALLVAVILGCLDCVRALVEAGADVNAKTMDGKTPLHLTERVNLIAYLRKLSDKPIPLP